jgi:hypothetical protein
MGDYVLSLSKQTDDRVAAITEELEVEGKDPDGKALKACQPIG